MERRVIVAWFPFEDRVFLRRESGDRWALSEIASRSQTLQEIMHRPALIEGVLGRRDVCYSWEVSEREARTLEYWARATREIGA